MTWFNVVNEHVARNPVARAIQKRQIAEAVRDFSLRCHLLDDGEVVPEDLDAAARVLAVAMAVLELRGDDDPVIRGALSCITERARMGCRWRRIDAPAIDVGLRNALAVYMAATQLEIQRAYWAIHPKEAA